MAPAQPVTAVARRPGFVINRSFNCYRAGGGREKKEAKICWTWVAPAAERRGTVFAKEPGAANRDLSNISW